MEPVLKNVIHNTACKSLAYLGQNVALYSLHCSYVLAAGTDPIPTFHGKCCSQNKCRRSVTGALVLPWLAANRATNQVCSTFNKGHGSLFFLFISGGRWLSCKGTFIFSLTLRPLVEVDDRVPLGLLAMR
jgi:hypothetical protein